MADATESKYAGAGTTFWINEKGQRVEMNKAFADENELFLFNKGWRPLDPLPVITLDELDSAENEALHQAHSGLFNKVRICAEGLITKEPALLHDGQRSIVGDQTTEYRCEIQADQEHDWHEDGEYRWKTY